jgi:hypothetical protein
MSLPSHPRRHARAGAPTPDFELVHPGFVAVPGLLWALAIAGALLLRPAPEPIAAAAPPAPDAPFETSFHGA